jgi:hypothetical protein
MAFTRFLYEILIAGPIRESNQSKKHTSSRLSCKSASVAMSPRYSGRTAVFRGALSMLSLSFRDCGGLDCKGGSEIVWSVATPEDEVSKINEIGIKSFLEIAIDTLSRESFGYPTSIQVIFSSA